MTNLDVFKLSAAACGHPAEVAEDGAVWVHRINARGFSGSGLIRAGGFIWNPFTDDSQRWECEKQLLKLLGLYAHIVMNQERLAIWPITPGFCETIVMPYGFPVEKFHATALAELERRKVPK